MKPAEARTSKYEKIVSLAKRRGFFWPSYEVYGGLSGFIDLGPLGVLLKQKLLEHWREVFVKPHQEFIVEVETPVITPQAVFKASGHLDHFTDYVVECEACGGKFRADTLIEEQAPLKSVEGLSEEELWKVIQKHGVKCPECGGNLSKPEKFNLLFSTTIGPFSEHVGYARPEAAQGMFVNFQRVYTIMREKMPLGIAQIGRVFRNEISPRQGPIRLREFTIMEIELFFDPQNPKCEPISEVENEELTIRFYKSGEVKTNTIEAFLRTGVIMNEWNAYFMYLAVKYMKSLGVPFEKQIFIEKGPKELAHYAKQTFDQAVWLERWGWVEVSGHAYRTDYDLRAHIAHSGQEFYAKRILEKPRVRKIAKVHVDKRKIGQMFREKAKEVFEKIKELDAEYVKKSLSEKGYVELNGTKIPAECISVIIEEVKESIEKYVPHVAEPSFGAERVLYSVLEYAYSEKEGRVVLRLPPFVAPIQVAIFPLVQSPELVKKAKFVYSTLKRRGFMLLYDESGSIGRRYARADEIGVPFAITIDHETLENDTVTVRDRDSWKQVRVKVAELTSLLEKLLSGEKPFKDLL